MLANNEFKWKELEVIHRKGEGWSFSVLHVHYLKTFPEWKLFHCSVLLLTTQTCVTSLEYICFMLVSLLEWMILLKV